MLLILWLLMAILWVYLPRYSTTDFGLPKGFLAKITHGFCHNSCRICSYFMGSFALSFWQYFALNTFDKALTGNKNLPFVGLFCHCPSLPIPPPGTMQCNAGADVNSIVAPKCAKPQSFPFAFPWLCQKFAGFPKWLQTKCHRPVLDCESPMH